MATTISDGTATLTAMVLDGYSAKRDTENVVHNILGTTDNAVTLRGTGLRKGTLKLVVGASDSLASQWDNMLRQPKTFTMTDTDRPWLGMKFACTGVSLDLDDATREVWIVSAEFEEVA